jgi:glyoxylase-like metal-dependent hydrolase (beta-lactamase superfamily II)
MKIEKIVGGFFLTNCYLLESEKEIFVLDPGFSAEKILKEIEKKKKKVKAILISHYHKDHTLGALEIKEKTKAPIFAGEKEKDFLDFKADKYLKEGDKLKINSEELLILETPGHSQGSISFLGNNFIFVGDLIFQDGYGRTDLKGGSEKELKETFEKLKKILKKGIKIFPGHGPEFEYESENIFSF